MDKTFMRANRQLDITRVNPAQLVDIRSVTIDTTLPVAKRIKDYITQAGTPYCFTCDGMIVHVEFAQTQCTLEERLAGYISQKYKSGDYEGERMQGDTSYA